MRAMCTAPSGSRSLICVLRLKSQTTCSRRTILKPTSFGAELSSPRRLHSLIDSGEAEAAVLAQPHAETHRPRHRFCALRDRRFGRARDWAALERCTDGCGAVTDTAAAAGAGSLGADAG